MDKTLIVLFMLAVILNGVMAGLLSRDSRLRYLIILLIVTGYYFLIFGLAGLFHNAEIICKLSVTGYFIMCFTAISARQYFRKRHIARRSCVSG